jgi:predicted acylesterase/phospholipase RssA
MDFGSDRLMQACISAVRPIAATRIQWGVAVVILTVLASGCTLPQQRTTLPDQLADVATVPGIPRARFWGDRLPPWFDDGLDVMRTQLATYFTEYEMTLPSNYLAISGGGPNGAFGAGLLNGWTESGERPPFVIVTGISTGAFIAPFAFLGPDYDETLKELYTTISTEDIIVERPILSAIFGESLDDTSPLDRLLRRYITEDVMHGIAAKFREGRRLFIGTTNLDAGRPVIWDISEIASSGAPNALELIRKVLLASASIPGVFPPVYIDVVAYGKQFDEMHVDGGVTSQLFLYPASLHWNTVAQDLALTGRHRLYIIRNGHLSPVWQPVEPKLLPIVERSISSLVRTQGIGDLYRMYIGTQRDGIEYYLADIPATFKEEREEEFDSAYMSKLFELGYKAAKHGYPWRSGPPGFESSQRPLASHDGR